MKNSLKHRELALLARKVVFNQSVATVYLVSEPKSYFSFKYLSIAEAINPLLMEQAASRHVDQGSVATAWRHLILI